MSATYVTRTDSSRQLSALHTNLEVADSMFCASFETPIARLWGIREDIWDIDTKAQLVTARLDFIITLKDRRKLPLDEAKVVAADVIKAMLNGRGVWSDGQRPDIVTRYDDPEVTQMNSWMMSRSVWMASVFVQATFDYDPEPAGYHEWMSSRGVR